MLDVFMTSDAGRRWALARAVPGGRAGRHFFPKPFYRFHRDGGDGQGHGEGLAQIYATSDGGKHWREVSVINELSARRFQRPVFCQPPRRLPQWVLRLRWPGLLRTSDGGRKWGYIPSRRPITAMAGPPTPRCSRPQRSAAWSWR